MTESFGKYELIERIGKGGMAEVFLARSVGAEGVEKTLVIKRILPELSTDERFVEMFISEAKIAMGLNHPNIVQIYDFGKVDDAYYLAMEYIEGVELGRLLQAARRIDEPFAVGDAVYLAMEVARGLDYAHRREDTFGRNLGLVHCDISPENLMVSRDGMIKIVDFGIARVSSVQDHSGEQLKGKYRYMSPEQARGEPVDQRSDLFSLAAVLFEMVCGRPLFKGDTPEETRSLVLSAVVPEVQAINPAVPEPLEHVIYKGLARRPEERFESARKFQADLTRVLYGLSEIHDTTTVAQYVSTVEAKLPSDSLEMMLASVKKKESGGETPLTLPGKTPSQGVTPVARPDWERSGQARDDGNSPRRATQRKEAVILSGRIERNGEQGKTSRLLTDEIQRLVESIAYKNNGVVHHIEAAEFAVLLGIPISDESDAARGARMALDVVDAISELGFGHKFTLNCRICLAVGEVIVDEVAAEGERHYEWSLEDSSRQLLGGMRTHMDDASILVDGAIAGRIQREFYCESVAEIEEPSGAKREVLRLRRPKSVKAQLREIRESFHSFYGRDIARRVLRDSFRQALFDEQARALLVLGRSGVGKSTMVEEFLSGLNPQDVQVVRGMASPFNRDIPMASAVALFSQMLRINPNAEPSDVRATIRARLDGLLGEEKSDKKQRIETSLRRLFSVANESDGFSRLSGVERRQRLLVTLREITNRLGAQKPLVLAIDDVHHIDPVMMNFAAEYFDQRQKSPVFFVGTARSSGPHLQTRSWRDLIRARYLNVETLGELARPEAERMVRDLLANYGAGQVDALVELVLQRSGGNPLYIKEMIGALDERRLLEPDIEQPQEEVFEDLLPASVEGLVRARIDRQETADQEALRRLSLLPSPFSVEQARSVIDGQCASLLDHLVEQDLLERIETDSQGDDYRFVNAVTRDVVQRSLVDEKAALLHRRIADYLLARRDEYDSALIARHLEAAGDLRQALEFYEEAVERAFREVGADQCLRLCDRMLAMPQLEDQRRFRVLKWRETALRELGERRKTGEVLEQLEALVEGVGDHDDRIEVAIRRARFSIAEGQFDAARRAVKQVLQLADDTGDRLGKADAWRVEAIVELNEGRRDRALTLIDRAIASLNIGGDRRARKTLVEAYNVRGVILRQSGRHREAMEAYETALAAAEDLRAPTLMRQLLINSGLALAYVGEFAEAQRRYRRALEACRRLGHRRDEALVWINLGDLYRMMGQYDRSIKSARRGIYMARRSETPMTVADGQITLGLCYLEQGELDRARRFLDEGLVTAKAMPSTYLIVCALLGIVQVDLQSQAVDDVEAALERAPRILERAQQAGMMWAVIMAHEVMAQGWVQLEAFEKALDHSNTAVEMLAEIDLLGIDQVLLTHAKLLDHVDAAPQRRREIIRRAHGIFKDRRDGLDSDEDRRAFEARPINQEILALINETDPGPKPG